MASTIRTSDSGWLSKYASACKQRLNVLLVDDAGIGIDPDNESIREMGKKAKLDPSDWFGVLIAIGLGSAGLWMIRSALVAPEPTSKLSLLVGGGCVALLGGAYSAIYILTECRPHAVKVTADGFGFEVQWDSA